MTVNLGKISSCQYTMLCILKFLSSAPDVLCIKQMLFCKNDSCNQQLNNMLSSIMAKKVAVKKLLCHNLQLHFALL